MKKNYQKKVEYLRCGCIHDREHDRKILCPYHRSVTSNRYKTGNKKFDEKVAAAMERDRRSGMPVTNKIYTKLGMSEEPEKQNKYNVESKEMRTYKDGFVFASRSELERWDYLLKIQQVGEIKDLERQVPFVLQESFISKQKEWGDVRAIIYVADFVYTNISFRKEYPGRRVIEDSKTGIRTSDYKIKRRMLLHNYGEYLFFEV